MLGGVVGDAVLPAAPDDVEPGAGEDADGVRMVDVNVVLEAGTNITVPVEARELGFPVGFWATALPEGELLYEVVPTAD